MCCRLYDLGTGRLPSPPESGIGKAEPRLDVDAENSRGKGNTEIWPGPWDRCRGAEGQGSTG